MIIRKAKETDMDAFIELCRAMYAEADFKNMEFSEDKCRAFCLVVMATGLAIVVEKDARLVGMFGAGLQQHIFTNTFMSMDYLIYVIPEYRGTRIADRMLKIYIEWALAHKIKRENIYIGINAGINTEKIERFYSKIGFKRTGVNLRLQEV